MVHYSMWHLYWRIRIPTPASSKSLPPLTQSGPADTAPGGKKRRG